MNAYWIGLSGLGVGQRALDIIGQNIANANTPGYHRQRVDLASVTYDGRIGAGVTIDALIRAESPALRAAIVSGNGELGRLEARSTTEFQVETALTSGPDSIASLLGRFFDSAEQLTTRPDDPTQRRLLLSAGTNLAGRFVAVAGDLDRLRASVRDQVGQTVSQINDLSHRIAELNKRIVSVQAQGNPPPSDLRDSRDQLINDLSRLVEVRTYSQADGALNVIGPGAALVVGGIATDLSAAVDANGQLAIAVDNGTSRLNARGGKLGGLLQEYNQVLPAYRDRLDTLAATFIQRVNAIQATGLGIDGPLTNIVGTQSIPDPSVPLTSAGLPFPIQAGQIAISVTDFSTGQRTLAQVSVDPATQSLQDIAAAITAATGNQVQASIDPATGALRLQAQSGFGFDFAGRLPTSPTSIAINGTSIPTVTGTYTGAGNDVYTFQVLGTGTIGTTGGLQLEVRNSANTIVATVDIGAGYTPGAALSVGNGISVALSAGTTDNGTFAIPVTSAPDTTGLLAALGINGIFTGSSAATIGVNPALLANPALLGLSRNGDPGDVSNLLRLASVRDAPLLANGTQSLAQFHGALAGDVGSEVRALGDQQAAQTSLAQNLFAQEQSIVGVDTNEESVGLVQYQRLIEASTRYLTVINSALDAILDIIR